MLAVSLCCTCTCIRAMYIVRHLMKSSLHVHVHVHVCIYVGLHPDQ